MEEQECEIVFVSNKSQKKKENILDALAKYKLKQQEQQQHDTIKMKAGSSKENETINDSRPLPVKSKVSKETSEEEKGQEISLKKQSSAKSLGKSQITEVNKEQYNPLPWRYNKNERNRLKMEYVQHLAKSENKPYLMKNDFEIGITEYISQGKGFSADVNQSHLDFQVLY
jgi:tRNA pseudouridine13 synthase